MSSDSFGSPPAGSPDKAGNRTGMERDCGPAEELGLTTYQYGDPTESSGPLAGPSNQVRTMLRPDDTSVQYFYSPYGCRTHRWVNAGAPVDPETEMPETGVDTFTWDRENRLVSSTIAAPAPPGVDRTAGAYTFRYDHRTRRLLRQSPSASALITYSGGLSVQEYDASSTGGGSSSGSSSGAGSPLVEYIRGSDYGGGIGGILYTIREGQASCQHYNSRGDVVAKSGADTTAAVTWAAAYLAFGTRPEEVGTNPDPQRANTKEEDGTGLLNEGHRYRCLETGMFVSRDPAGFVDGPNLYAYVEQNPWTSFDPEGLATDEPDIRRGYAENPETNKTYRLYRNKKTGDRVTTTEGGTTYYKADVWEGRDRFGVFPPWGGKAAGQWVPESEVPPYLLPRKTPIVHSAKVTALSPADAETAGRIDWEKVLHVAGQRAKESFGALTTITTNAALYGGAAVGLFQAAQAGVKLAFSSGSKAIFYSGNQVALSEARTLAKNIGGKLMEDTVGGRIAASISNKLTKNGMQTEGTAVIKWASKMFARNAKEAHAVLRGPTVTGSGKIFADVELPELAKRAINVFYH